MGYTPKSKRNIESKSSIKVYVDRVKQTVFIERNGEIEAQFPYDSVKVIEISEVESLKGKKLIEIEMRAT